MSLPSKKQLHKHKRGTRKALDTLDALEQAAEKAEGVSDREVEHLVKKKRGKQSLSPKPPLSQGPDLGHVVIDETGELSARMESESLGHLVDSQPMGLSDLQPRGNATDEPPEKPVFAENTQIKIKEEPAGPPIAAKRSNTSKKRAITQEVITVISPPNGHETKKDEEIESITMNQKDDSWASSLEDETDEDTQKDKYLTFRIGNENYGIPIRFVTEIIVMQRITEVPDTPSFVNGVINLRGQVIPVIDIRKRFLLEAREYDERTCIVVVNHDEVFVGLIVDTVNEVVDIPETQVDPPPKAQYEVKSSYIMGLGKIGATVTILLDVQEVLFVEELMKKRYHDET